MLKYSGLLKSEVINYLGDFHDFELTGFDEETDWINLKPNVPFKIIAGEDSGGVYIAYGEGYIEERPILFISSEGQAGKLGDNLQNFISMIVEIPYWFDLLKFSGGGQLTEMRKTSVFMNAEFNRDFPNYDKAQSFLKSQLTLSKVKMTMNKTQVEI